MNSLPGSLLSLLSQGLVSSVSLISSLVLLHFGRPGEYGNYVLFLSVYMLLFSLTNAVLLHPMATLSCRMQAQRVRHTMNIGRIGMIVPGLLGGGGLGGYWWLSARHAALPVAWGWLAVVFFLMLCRDIRRAAWLLDSDLINLLKMDFGYCVMAMLLLGTAILRGHVGLFEVLIAISLPALPGLLHRFHPMAREYNAAPSIANEPGWLEIWHCARWALPGVLVGWLFTSGYWFFLDSTQGKFAVTLLAATRLLYTPLGLACSGWTSYFRPVMARLEHAGAHGEKDALIRRSYRMVLILVTGYIVVLCAVLGFWPRVLPGTVRPGLVLVATWGGYFLVQWIRMVRTTGLLSSPAGFRTSFNAGVVSCFAFYLLLLPISVYVYQPVICPLLLMLGEVMNFCLMKEKSPRYLGPFRA